jgi:F420 biosynthesis protein FbiB-like protein
LTNTDLHNLVRTRRSIRKFTPQVVSEDVLTRILETATYAPSAHNRQPWRFTVLTTREPKSRLAEAMATEFARDLSKDGLAETEIAKLLERSKSRINGAPVAIVVCMDPSEMDQYPDDRRRNLEMLMATQSVAAAITNLLLAAHAEGLGSVWTCGPLFAPEVVRETLNLPETWEPQAMIFLGYPDETPKTKKIKPLNEITRWL